MATQMATQGPSDPLEPMPLAQGKIIEDLDDQADIADGVA